MTTRTNKKGTVTKTAGDLAKALGLAKEDAVEMELKSDLNTKVIEVVRKQGLTHAAVAKKTQISRTQITALLNRNTHDVSTELMVRILASLGYETKVQAGSRASKLTREAKKRMTKYSGDFPLAVRPGEVLREMLQEMHISQAALARQLAK